MNDPVGLTGAAQGKARAQTHAPTTNGLGDDQLGKRGRTRATRFENDRVFAPRSRRMRTQCGPIAGPGRGMFL
jgi:hypothetical protein